MPQKSPQKSPCEWALMKCMDRYNKLIILLIPTGNHRGMERERVKKKPGKAVIISGTSTEPPIHDEPINVSDTSEYVMEYTGRLMFVI